MLSVHIVRYCYLFIGLTTFFPFATVANVLGYSIVRSAVCDELATNGLDTIHSNVIKVKCFLSVCVCVCVRVSLSSTKAPSYAQIHVKMYIILDLSLLLFATQSTLLGFVYFGLCDSFRCQCADNDEGEGKGESIDNGNDDSPRVSVYTRLPSFSRNSYYSYVVSVFDYDCYL